MNNSKRGILAITSLLALAVPQAHAKGDSTCRYARSHQQCVTVPLASNSEDITAKGFSKPNDGQARIYILRPSISVRRQTSKILFDGKPLAEIAPYTYVAIDVSPGLHCIRALADREGEIQINVSAKKLLYVELSLSLLFNTVRAELAVIDEQTGQLGVTRSMRAISRFDK